MLFIFPAFIALSNSAQPGLWGAHGTGTFSLLYPEDEFAFKKIQMIDEQVTVKLYDNFATVKGTYWMYNETRDTIKIKTGYPQNSTFEHQRDYRTADVIFDDFYGLKVFTNKQSAEILNNQYHYNVYNDINNWYIWNTTFLPQDTTKIEVYFLVKTTSTISEGYNRDDANGFIYILESGSTWKQPIKKGLISIWLTDDLESIRGIDPDSNYTFSKIGNVIKAEFTNLSPTDSNNIILTYDGSDSELEYDQVRNELKKYYSELDSLESKVKSLNDFEPKEFGDPFEVHSFGMNPLIWMVLAFIVSAIIIMFILTKAIQLIIKTLPNKL